MRLGETLFHVLGRCRVRGGLIPYRRPGFCSNDERSGEDANAELLRINGLTIPYIHLYTFPRRNRQLPFSIRRLLTRLRVLD